jgi:tryptophanyl-tRNA synthetase
MTRILSGIRATGKLHFGSLVGAVQNFVTYQNQDNTECLYFVADYHSLTTLDDPEQLRSNLIEIVKDYLAAGLDPNRSILYAQSSVPQIAELSLLLGMSQPLGDLERVPTFKDLVRKNPDRVTLGLITYPVLMAADILATQADIVPVGSDQIPNVEMARSLASRFNNRYGKTFNVPGMMEEMVKVPGLDGGKMGKSEADKAIGISMSRDEILAQYLKHGVTDRARTNASIPGNPDECMSVYPMHKLVTPGEPDNEAVASMCRKAEIGCKACKELMVDNLYRILGPFQERRSEYTNQDNMVKEVLADGGARARALISPTVELTAERMGITRFNPYPKEEKAYARSNSRS